MKDKEKEAAIQLLHRLEDMRNDWAEVDAARKTELWRNVHHAADELREALEYQTIG